MPIYVYQTNSPAKECVEDEECMCVIGFEILQPISADPLVKCPECGGAIKKVIQAAQINIGKKHLLKDKNLKKQGFTKLVNEGDGKYRKI